MHPFPSAPARSRMHEGNLFVIFLAVGSDFQTRDESWARNQAPLTELPAVSFSSRKLSEKHFALDIEALCPCEKDLSEVILFYFFF